MKLRKLFATAAMALFVGATAMAQAPTVENVRIYINPGHGSWTSGDRHMATVFDPEITRIDPDTTGFFESNTNLQKFVSVTNLIIKSLIPQPLINFLVSSLILPYFVKNGLSANS